MEENKPKIIIVSPPYLLEGILIFRLPCAGYGLIIFTFTEFMTTYTRSVRLTAQGSKRPKMS